MPGNQGLRRRPRVDDPCARRQEAAARGREGDDRPCRRRQEARTQEPRGLRAHRAAPKAVREVVDRLGAHLRTALRWGLRPQDHDVQGRDHEDVGRRGPGAGGALRPFLPEGVRVGGGLPPGAREGRREVPGDRRLRSGADEGRVRRLRRSCWQGTLLVRGEARSQGRAVPGRCVDDRGSPRAPRSPSRRPWRR